MLGLSRVMLAMGRRGDMPAKTAELSTAIIVVGGLITVLAATGSVKTTWSFSAFTVLIYYAVTNLAALQLNSEQRLYSRLWAWAGLFACLSLAFAIEWPVWVTGICVLLVGLLWHALRKRYLRASEK